MPHDCFGRRIEVGDWIECFPYNLHGKRRLVGRVSELKEEQSCSGKVSFLNFGRVSDDYFGASQCKIILKSNGQHPLVGKYPEVGDAVQYTDDFGKTWVAEVVEVHSQDCINLRFSESMETSIPHCYDGGIRSWRFPD